MARVESLSLDAARAKAEQILAQVERVIVGKHDEVELVMLALLARGHVLIEDVPGVAKTLMAHSFAQATGLGFSRIQFTPDVMPSDVTGSFVFDQRTNEFVFRQGAVFANLVLADEINRAPPKTQAALLEAMQEGQVTTEGVTKKLQPPFHVLATQNPIDHEGTYPLPEAQVDRFLIRMRVGYPSPAQEQEILQRRIEREADEVVLEPVLDGETLCHMQMATERVHVADPILAYVVAIVAATRRRSELQLGSSPRGSLALLKLSRARALLSGRDWVSPEDVKAIAPAALAHRLMIKPELWVREISQDRIISEVIESVPAPRAEGIAIEAVR